MGAIAPAPFERFWQPTGIPALVNQVDCYRPYTSQRTDDAPTLNLIKTF